MEDNKNINSNYTFKENDLKNIYLQYKIFNRNALDKINFTYDDFLNELKENPNFIDALKDSFTKQVGSEYANKVFKDSKEEFFNYYKFYPDSTDKEQIINLSQDSEDLSINNVPNYPPIKKSEFEGGQEYSGYFGDLWKNFLSPTLRGIGEILYESFQISTGLSNRIGYRKDLEGNLVPTTATQLGMYFSELGSQAFNKEERDSSALFYKNLAFKSATKIQNVYNQMNSDEKEKFKKILEKITNEDIANNILNVKKPEDIESYGLLTKFGLDFDRTFFAGVTNYAISKVTRYKETQDFDDETIKLLEKYKLYDNNFFNEIENIRLSLLNAHESDTEWYARTAYNVLLHSIQIIRGVQGIKSGLGIKTFGKNSKKFSELFKGEKGSIIAGKEAEILAKELNLPNPASGYKFGFKNGQLEAIEAPNKLGLRFGQLIEFTNKSIKAQWTNIVGEINQEKLEAEVRGIPIDGSFYSSAFLGKIANAYFDSLGEFGGTMLQPFVDGLTSKFIKEGIFKKLVNHAIANPLSESIEERITDTFQQYIPLLFQGQAPETIESLTNKLATEYITFLPLTFTGAGLDILQSERIKSIIDKFNKSKSPQEKIQKPLKYSTEQILENLFKRLNNIKNELTDEERKEFEKYIGLGFDQITDFFADEKTGITIKEEIERKKSELLKQESENINNAEIGKSRAIELINKISNRTKKPNILESYNQLANILYKNELNDKDLNNIENLTNDLLKSTKKPSRDLQELLMELEEIVKTHKGLNEKLNNLNSQTLNKIDALTNFITNELGKLFPSEKVKTVSEQTATKEFEIQTILPGFNKNELKNAILLARSNDEKAKQYGLEKVRNIIENYVSENSELILSKIQQVEEEKTNKTKNSIINNLIDLLGKFSSQFDTVDKIQNDLQKLERIETITDENEALNLKREFYKENIDKVLNYKKRLDEIKKIKPEERDKLLSEEDKKILKNANLIEAIYQQDSKIAQINFKKKETDKIYNKLNNEDKKKYYINNILLRIADKIINKDVKFEIQNNAIKNIYELFKDKEITLKEAKQIPFINEFLKVSNGIVNNITSQLNEEKRLNLIEKKISSMEDHDSNEKPINEKGWTKAFVQAFGLNISEENNRFIDKNDKVGVSYQIHAKTLPLLVKFFKKLGYYDYEILFINNETVEFNIYVGSHNNAKRVKSKLDDWKLSIKAPNSSKIILRDQGYKAFIETIKNKYREYKELEKLAKEEEDTEGFNPTFLETIKKSLIRIKSLANIIKEESDLYWKGINAIKSEERKKKINAYNNLSLQEKEKKLKKLNNEIMNFRNKNSKHNVSAINKLLYKIIQLRKTKNKNRITGKVIYQLEEEFNQIKTIKLSDNVSENTTNKTNKKQKKSFNRLNIDTTQEISSGVSIEIFDSIDDKIKQLELENFYNTVYDLEYNDTTELNKKRSEKRLRYYIQKFLEFNSKQQLEIIKLLKQREKNNKDVKYLVTSEELSKVVKSLTEQETETTDKSKKTTSSNTKLNSSNTSNTSNVDNTSTAPRSRYFEEYDKRVKQKANQSNENTETTQQNNNQNENKSSFRSRYFEEYDKRMAQETQQQTESIKVEIFKGNWTREQVAKETNKVFLFGDNTKDRTETKYIPKTTQAVIRGLSNAIGIDTKKDRETKESSYFSDEDFKQFKKQVDEAIAQAKASGKIIVIPENGIGTGKAKLKEKAPKLYKYLQQEINKLINESKTKQETKKDNEEINPEAIYDENLKNFYENQPTEQQSDVNVELLDDIDKDIKDIIEQNKETKKDNNDEVRKLTDDEFDFGEPLSLDEEFKPKKITKISEQTNKAFNNEKSITLGELTNKVKPKNKFQEIISKIITNLFPNTLVIDLSKIDFSRLGVLGKFVPLLSTGLYANADLINNPNGILLKISTASRLYQERLSLGYDIYTDNLTKDYFYKLLTYSVLYEISKQFTKEQLTNGVILINTLKETKYDLDQIIYHEGTHSVLGTSLKNNINSEKIKELTDILNNIKESIINYYGSYESIPFDIKRIFESNNQIEQLDELFATIFGNRNYEFLKLLYRLNPEGKTKKWYEIIIDKIAEFLADLLNIENPLEKNNVINILTNELLNFVNDNYIYINTVYATQLNVLRYLDEDFTSQEYDKLRAEILNIAKTKINEVLELSKKVKNSIANNTLTPDVFVKRLINVIKEKNNLVSLYYINLIYAKINNLDLNKIYLYNESTTKIVNSIINTLFKISPETRTTIDKLLNEGIPNRLNTSVTNVQNSNHQKEMKEENISETLPIENYDMTESLLTEYETIINDSILFVKDLGIFLAKLYKNSKLANLYYYLKNNNVSLVSFMNLFDSNTVEGKFADDILKNIWEVKYRYKGIKYDDWKRLSLTKVYSNVISKKHFPFVRLTIETFNNKIINANTTTELGFQFIDSEGNRITTMVGRSRLENYISLLSLIFGKLNIHFIGEITENINLGENILFKKIKYKDLSKKGKINDIIKKLYENNGYIFLGRFADKNTLPIIKVEDKNKLENSKQLIDAILRKYKELSGNPNIENNLTFAEKISLLFNILFSEMMLGGNIEKILTGNFKLEDSVLLQKTTKNGKEKPNSLFKILKRVPYILPKVYSEGSFVKQKYNITKDPTTSKVPGLAIKEIDGREVVTINHVTFATDSLDGSETINIDGKEYNLKELLFNKYGTEITDGISLAVETNNNNSFFDFYNDYYGEVKEGPIKQFTFRFEPGDSMYLKHSIQKISIDDPIGKWMYENNITVLSFESANKLTNQNKLVKSFDNKPIIDTITMDEMSHNYVKGEIQSKVKAIRQAITATYLFDKNKNIPLAKELIKSFKTLLKNVRELRINNINKAIKPEQLYDRIIRIIKSPTNYFESKLSNALSFLKDISKEDFIKNYYDLIKYPSITELIESYILDELESSFAGDMDTGSALTLTPDLGVLASKRLSVIKKQIESYNRNNPDNQINVNEVFDENGRLKEGYTVISRNFAKEKDIRIGDYLIHALIPIDSLLGLNASKVVAVLDDRYMSAGSLMLNSEYTQSIIGRDFDIDVLYTFGFDSRIFSQEQWMQFINQIQETQKHLRKNYVEIVKKVYNKNPNIKKRIAEELGIKFSDFTINDESMAFNKVVQKGFMQALYGLSESEIYSMFDMSLFSAKELFRKIIGPEVQQRNIYTALLATKFKSFIKFKNNNGKETILDINAANKDQPINDIKHIIATNDKVDAPNRENIFYYKYNEQFDLLMDLVGYEKAIEIYENSEFVEKYLNVIYVVLNALFENYLVVTKSYDTNDKIDRNLNSYLRRIKKQQEINKYLKILVNNVKNGEEKNNTAIEKLTQILKEVVESRYYYSPQPGSFILSKYYKNEVEPLLTQTIKVILNNLSDFDVKGSPIMEMVDNFDFTKIPILALSRKEYIEIENTSKYNILERYVKPKLLELLKKVDEKETYRLLESYDSSAIKAGIFVHMNNDKPIFNQWGLARVYSAMQAIIALQSEFLTDSGTTANTYYSQGRNDIYPLFFKEVMYHDKVYTIQENSKIIQIGKYGDKNISIQSKNGDLIFYIDNFPFTRQELTGLDKLSNITPDAENELKTLRKALFSEGEDNILRDADVRIRLDQIFNMLKVDLSYKQIPSNINTRDRKKVMVDFLKKVFSLEYKGEKIFNETHQIILLSFLLGNNSESIAKYQKQRNFFETNPGNIENLERYKEIKEGKSEFEAVDYGTNIEGLEIINQVNPKLAKEFVDEFVNYIRLKGLKVNTDLDNDFRHLTEFNNDYYNIDDTPEETTKKFVDFNIKKYSSLINSKSILAIKFIKELLASSDNAYRFLRELTKDITLLKAIRIYDPENISIIIKELKTKTFEQFKKDYNNIEFDFDTDNFLDVLLDRYNLSIDEKNNIKGYKVKRKLFLIFLSIIAQRDNYLKERNPITNIFKTWFFNAEMYSINNQLRVYDIDEEETIGYVPLFDSSINEYRELKYSPKHLKIIQAEYLSQVNDVPPGLSDEAQYRVFHLENGLKKLKYQLQTRLSNISNNLRIAKNEIANNPYFKFNGNFEGYFKRRVYDIAENVLKRNGLKIIKHNNKYYLQDKEGITYTVFENEKGIESILDTLYPLQDYNVISQLGEKTKEFANEMKKQKENELNRLVLKSAVEARIMFDYEVPIILKQMHIYISKITNLAAQEGNVDIYNKLIKMSEDYMNFLVSFKQREGSYIPRYWTRTNYIEAFKEHNYFKLKQEYLEDNPDATEEEIEKYVDSEIKKILSFITVDGFGMTFNPNAQMRKLPDYYVGYEKDIFRSINNYINNMYQMISSDITRIEWSLYQIKSAFYGEDPIVHDAIRKWYAKNIRNNMDVEIKIKDVNQISKGDIVEFSYYNEEDETDHVITGTINNIVEKNGKKVINLENYNGEIISFSEDKLYIYNSFGDKVKGKVKKHRPSGIIEYLKELERKYKYTEENIKHNIIRYIEMPLSGSVKAINYLLTMSILGTITQLPATILNFLGGTINNLQNAVFRNTYFMFKKGDLEKHKKEIMEDVEIKMGLRSVDYLMDMASYGDIDFTRLGVDESFISGIKGSIKAVTDELKKRITNKSTMIDLYAQEIKKLKIEYYKSRNPEIRKKIYLKTLEFTNQLYEADFITSDDYEERKQYYEYIFSRYKDALPIDKDIYNKISVRAELKTLNEFLFYKFNSSYLGMKLFVAPEKSLRINGLVIDYYQAEKVLNNADERLQWEYAMIGSNRKHKLYGNFDSQFGRRTELGKLLFKFAHYSFDELTRLVKIIPLAIKSTMLYGIKPINEMTDKILDSKGKLKKIKTGNNLGYFLFKSFTIVYMLNMMSELFVGIINPLSPIRSFIVKLFRYLSKNLYSIYKRIKDGNLKLKREDYEILRDGMQALGLGYGLTAPVVVYLWSNIKEDQKGDFPLIPRAYRMMKSFVNLFEEEEPYDNSYKQINKTINKYRKFERTITGMNIISSNPYANERIKNLSFFGKLQELYNRPTDYFPIIKDTEKLFKNINKIKNDDSNNEIVNKNSKLPIL